MKNKEKRKKKIKKERKKKKEGKEKKERKKPKERRRKKEDERRRKKERSYSLTVNNVTNARTMLPAGGRPATSCVHYTTSCNTQSSAPEDGQNNCPKHVELTGIINKPLLLYLVGCLCYLYQ